ncbi:MAG: tripartite tricarboxylate transporter permease [Pseudomonadota bacterium]
MGIVDHIWLGIQSVVFGPALFSVLGLQVPTSIAMVVLGLFTGIMVGATPGLAGPMAMAVALPILISIFGVTPDALLPVFAFLIGIMKGATIGGAVPAILFNTPGTPDALLTTYDGHPMTKAGQSGKALRVAHVSSVTGDTVSDVVLFVCAPFLAIVVEAYLDFPEKTALIILSLAFMAAVIGRSVARGLISASLGMLAAFVATGEDFYPRLTFGVPDLAEGFPIAAAVLGVLIVGEIFKAMEDMANERRTSGVIRRVEMSGDNRLRFAEYCRLFPYIANSAAIGTAIGALPGIGSTLAATLGYASGKRLHGRKRAEGEPAFGEGASQGVAATEAANSAVSGANLIPVLSLGIPGNAAAVFLILATDSIGGFNPGPAVFKLPSSGINSEMVVAFGIFTLMAIANVFNWTIGGVIMRSMSVMIRIPKQYLLPVVLLVTLTAIYIQETNLAAVWFTIGFGVLGYLMRKLDMSVLPFVIAFILAGNLETTARSAFSASGGDPWFLVKSPIAIIFLLLAVGTIAWFSRTNTNERRVPV